MVRDDVLRLSDQCSEFPHPSVTVGELPQHLAAQRVPSQPQDRFRGEAGDDSCRKEE